MHVEMLMVNIFNKTKIVYLISKLEEESRKRKQNNVKQISYYNGKKNNNIKQNKILSQRNKVVEYIRYYLIYIQFQMQSWV